MRSSAIWRYLQIKKFATWRKIPEDGNPLTSNSLFIGKFQIISTQPYVYRNENHDPGKNKVAHNEYLKNGISNLNRVSFVLLKRFAGNFC